MMNLIVFLALICVAFSVPRQTPIIGIYTQSDSSDEPKLEFAGAGNYSYIASSYVKFLQMSGAQVVPIFSFNKNISYFDNLLPKLNGVLFPGGGEEININNIWTKNAEYILKYAMNENKKGNVFPIWATCLGWQLMAYLTSGHDSKVLSSVRSEKAVINRLSIKNPGYLFSDIPTSIKDSIENGVGIVYFNHIYAVSTNYPATNEAFRTFWNVAATTTSSYNEQFISAAEAKEYPFFGVQFHPQKNLFEWKVNADRSENGAQVVQIFSNKFVEKARTSKNSFASPEQFYKVSIYSHKAQKSVQGFMEIYLFNEVHSPISPQRLHLSTQ